MIGSRILGVGSFVPPQVWTNNDLTKLMDTSDEWIQQRTGIQERHWVGHNEKCGVSDLAYEASLKALSAANTKKEEIDLIIFATISPDYYFPGSGCILQTKLGLPPTAALDIRQQCSGFIYGMSVADAYIKSGLAKKILLVGAEVHSRALDKTTRGRDLAVLFGDGAGAVVIGPIEAAKTTDSQIYSTHLYSDGAHALELCAQLPGSANPGDWMSVEMMSREEVFPKMNGKLVFANACRRLVEAVNTALAHNKKKIEEVDLFVFHQANLRINEMVAKQLGVPAEKCFNTIQKFGNTTAATIPLGLDEAVKAGKLKPGSLVMSAAFGSGFTWASALYRW